MQSSQVFVHETLRMQFLYAWIPRMRFEWSALL